MIVGPVTYLWLGKAKDDSDKLALLPRLLPVYAELLDDVWRPQGVEWVQIDEPVLVTELDADVAARVQHCVPPPQVLPRRSCCWPPTSAHLQENLHLAANLPVAGLHVDAINAARAKCRRLLDLLPVQ